MRTNLYVFHVVILNTKLQVSKKVLFAYYTTLKGLVNGYAIGYYIM